MVVGELTRLRGLGERLLIIAAAEKAHIFDRFRTGSNIGLHGGTGLGLAPGPVDRAGARRRGPGAQRPGKGSMFELMLPAMTAAGEGPASIHAHAGAAESSGPWLPR